ncbi:MAG: biliverdin-producing heme oxygenase [Lewinella sp.]
MKASPNSLLDRLRKSTREQHDSLESVTLGEKIMDGSLSLPEYHRLVEWQQRTHQRLEPLVAAFQYGDYTYRPRFPLHELPSGEDSPAMARMLGILYVLEGSSLGGSIIYRKLQENPNLTTEGRFDFYRQQSEWGLKQWRSLVSVLNSVTLTEEEMELATQSARDTFDRFTAEWAALA